LNDFGGFAPLISNKINYYNVKQEREKKNKRWEFL